jgi:hypothetical protein
MYPPWFLWDKYPEFVLSPPAPRLRWPLVSFLKHLPGAMEAAAFWTAGAAGPTPPCPAAGPPGHWASLHHPGSRTRMWHSGRAHLGRGAASPSRCSSCSGPRRSASPETGGARCAPRTAASCNSGSAQWLPCRTGPRACQETRE